MRNTEAQIIIFIIACTVLMLFLAGFIVFFLLLYQKRYTQYKREKADMQASFHQELLKAEIEMKEQTLLTISQEIHDNIGQVLSLAKLNLNTILLEDNNPAVPKIAATKNSSARPSRTCATSPSRSTPSTSATRSSPSRWASNWTRSAKRASTKRPCACRAPKSPSTRRSRSSFSASSRRRSTTSSSTPGPSRSPISLDYDPRQTLLRIADDGAGFDLPAVHEPGRADRGTGMGNLFHRARLIDARLTGGKPPRPGYAHPTRTAHHSNLKYVCNPIAPCS
jgi:hypothetical protein